MRATGLIVLVLVAGGLAWGVWATRQQAAKEEVPSESLLGGRRLLVADRIILQRSSDAAALHFARADAQAPFQLVEPVVDLASAAYLESLRGVLDSAQRFLDGPVAEIPPTRLQQMGLDTPRGRIEVRYPDATIAIAIGLEGPLHQDLYVKMDGNVYRTGLAVWTAIQANVDDARERLLVQTHPEDIRRLALHRRLAGDAVAGQNKREVVEIERTGSTTFVLQQPLHTEADPVAAVNLFRFLSGMVVEQFLGELNPMPEWDVQIEVDGALGKERITIWQTPQGLIGRQEPRNIEFTIKSVDYSRTFQVAVDELRARLLVPMAMADIVRLEIDPGQGSGDRLQLRRGGGEAMSMYQPFEAETEPAPINDLLQATQQLQVVEFVGPAPAGLAAFGLDRGFLTVSLHPRSGETRPRVLHFGRDDGDNTFVKRGDEEFVMKVPKAAVDLLRRPWWIYPSRSVAVSVPANVGEIRYQLQATVAVALRRGADGKWLRSDSGADVSDQAAELVEIASTLRGKRTFDGNDPAVAADLAAARRVQVDFVATASGSAQTLVLHDRGGEKQGWVVRASQPRVVVELGPSDTRALLAPLPR